MDIVAFWLSGLIFLICVFSSSLCTSNYRGVHAKAGDHVQYLRGLMVFVFQLFSGWLVCFEGVWNQSVLKRELVERPKYDCIIIPSARLSSQSSVDGLADMKLSSPLWCSFPC